MAAAATTTCANLPFQPQYDGRNAAISCSLATAQERRPAACAGRSAEGAAAVRARRKNETEILFPGVPGIFPDQTPSKIGTDSDNPE